MKIFTHPDNLDLLKANLDRGDFDRPNSFNSIEVITNASIERDRATNRFRLRNGQVVEREAIKLQSTHWEYGPEDVEYLKFIGEIEEVREPVFNVMDESMIRMDFRNMFVRPKRFVHIMNSFA